MLTRKIAPQVGGIYYSDREDAYFILIDGDTPDLEVEHTFGHLLDDECKVISHHLVRIEAGQIGEMYGYLDETEVES